MTGSAGGVGACPRVCPFKGTGDEAEGCSLGPFCPTHPDECPFLGTSVRALVAASPPLPVSGGGRTSELARASHCGNADVCSRLLRIAALAATLVTAGCAAGVEYRVGEGLLGRPAREAAVLEAGGFFGRPAREAAGLEAVRLEQLQALRALLAEKGIGRDAIANPRGSECGGIVTRRVRGPSGGEVTTTQTGCL